MSSAEFAEWQAFYQLEPFGAWRDNYHAALIAMILARAHGAKNADVGDFMLKEPEPPRRKTGAEIFAAFKGWALAAGARPKH